MTDFLEHIIAASFIMSAGVCYLSIQNAMRPKR